MECTTLSAPGQVCVKVPLKRGDSYERTMDIIIDGQPADLSAWDLKMEIRERDGWPPVKTLAKADFNVDGNSLTLKFMRDDEIFKKRYKTLVGDVAFTNGDVTRHWIRFEFEISDTQTVTWKES